MMRFRVRRLAALALPAVLVVALSGCSIFAPDEGDVNGGGNQATYRVRTSPENVLHFSRSVRKRRTYSMSTMFR